MRKATSSTKYDGSEWSVGRTPNRPTKHERWMLADVMAESESKTDGQVQNMWVRLAGPSDIYHN